MKKITLLFILLITSIGLSQELITNGNFETGDETGWIGNAANVVTENNNNSYNSANVEAAGNAWDVSLSQVVSITNGETYTLRFDAWLDTNRTIIAGIGLNEAPWTSVNETITLSTTSQSYRNTQSKLCFSVSLTLENGNQRRKQDQLNHQLICTANVPTSGRQTTVKVSA